MIGLTGCADPQEQSARLDWRQDWALAEGFALSQDSQGFHLPTAIAFVPEPGDAPSDPLYFVTELRGAVKVVTNDRTVHLFADDFFSLDPAEELPAEGGESGLAGICLAPNYGYVFVTFAYQDAEGVLRNGLMRFQTDPSSFATAPTDRVDLSSVFAAEVSSASHQIGPCQVDGDLLFVSVGDGWQPPSTRSPESLLGKVARMTLDGAPAPDNPFAQVDRQTSAAADYVWALGLRNPFGLKIVGDRLFVADNGPSVDRFLEIRRGGDYLWDGTDWSISSAADFVFTPSQGPVQLDYLPLDSELFPPTHRGRFYVALAGTPSLEGPRRTRVEGVVSLSYDLRTNRLTRRPEYLLQYRGTGFQSVSGVAIGPDGLYFVPILPNVAGVSAIYRVFHAPQQPYPFVIGHDDDATVLLRLKGCYSCHSLDGSGGTAGPPLDRDLLVPRVLDRIDSREYVDQVNSLAGVEDEPFRAWREERAEVLEADGTERLRLWLSYHIQEPRFDNPNSQMPYLGVSEAESRRIADFLLGRPPVESASQRLLASARTAVLTVIPRPRYRHLALFFATGFVIGLLALGLARRLWAGASPSPGRRRSTS